MTFKAILIELRNFAEANCAHLEINSPSLGLILADRLNANRASFGIALGACANGGSAFLGAVLVR